MKILITGASGYIAQRLLPVLIEHGHDIICCVRNKDRISGHTLLSLVKILEIDFRDSQSVNAIPHDIDIAFYLIHSMATNAHNFDEVEQICAKNFIEHVQTTTAQQIIYVSGISNHSSLSKHLQSRKQVESVLATSHIPLTTLRAGIIIGEGSASFEIIRDLVEKLPIMIAPKWLLTKSQPIAIKNVIEILTAVIAKPETYNKTFDIGGSEILTYKEMLLQFAKVRSLPRAIYIVPVMTPKLSSYWLYFITSTSYRLAQSLVDSMKVEVICNKNTLLADLSISPINYKSAISQAFDILEQTHVFSSGREILKSSSTSESFRIQVPKFGCLQDVKKRKITSVEQTIDKIWKIGGATGWYYGTFLWKIRGYMDQCIGGVGLRRGRSNEHDITSGDTIDFWNVLYASKEEKRLLLFAEMKLPGEAWLEFTINAENVLIQTASFRPRGLWGRIYWVLALPFHAVIFRGLIKKLSE